MTSVTQHPRGLVDVSEYQMDSFNIRRSGVTINSINFIKRYSGFVLSPLLIASNHLPTKPFPTSDLAKYGIIKPTNATLPITANEPPASTTIKNKNSSIKILIYEGLISTYTNYDISFTVDVLNYMNDFGVSIPKRMLCIILLLLLLLISG
ncbi:hypothetical protein SC499_25615 [Peribacillus simplex]|nr:hypothetical protein [Peribacillus simplex]MDW7617940.1 hypothetical protein [Peribacillus simplex]